MARRILSDDGPPKKSTREYLSDEIDTPAAPAEYEEGLDDEPADYQDFPVVDHSEVEPLPERPSLLEALNKGLYFSGQDVPPPRSEYVCWIDMMGSQSHMQRSLLTSSICIGRLHAGIAEFRHPATRAYPMMDGAYITSTSKRAIFCTMRNILRAAAATFVHTELRHRFLVRGALSYGPIVHGRDLPPYCNQTLFHQRATYTNYIMFGIPVTQAFTGERHAPPFGIYITESARSNAPAGDDPFENLWLRWLHPNDALFLRVREALTEYYDWARKHSYELGYQLDRIAHHEELARQYFTPI